MAKRRGRGEGSVFRRKSDGRWCAAFVAGYREDGQPRRVTLYGDTQARSRSCMNSICTIGAGSHAMRGIMLGRTWAARGWSLRMKPCLCGY